MSSQQTRTPNKPILYSTTTKFASNKTAKSSVTTSLSQKKKSSLNYVKNPNFHQIEGDKDLNKRDIPVIEKESQEKTDDIKSDQSTNKKSVNKNSINVQLGQEVRKIFNGNNDNNLIIYNIKKLTEFIESTKPEIKCENNDIDHHINELKKRIIYSEKLKAKNDEIIKKNEVLEEKLDQYMTKENENKNIYEMIKSFYNNRQNYKESIKNDLDLSNKVRSIFNEEENNEVILRTIQSNKESADDNKKVDELSTKLQQLCEINNNEDELIQNINQKYQKELKEKDLQNYQLKKENDELKNNNINNEKQLSEIKQMYEIKIDELRNELLDNKKLFIQLRNEIFEQQKLNEQKQKENIELSKIVYNADDIKNKEIAYFKKELLSQLDKQKDLEISLNDCMKEKKLLNDSLSKLNEQLKHKDYEIDQLKNEISQLKNEKEMENIERKQKNKIVHSEIQELTNEPNEIKDTQNSKENQINQYQKEIICEKPTDGQEENSNNSSHENKKENRIKNQEERTNENRIEYQEKDKNEKENKFEVLKNNQLEDNENENFPENQESDQQIEQSNLYNQNQEKQLLNEQSDKESNILIQNKNDNMQKQSKKKRDRRITRKTRYRIIHQS